MKIKKPQLRKDILKMMRTDLKMTKRANDGLDYDKSIYKKHPEELKKIVKKYGWPTVTMVGKKANWGAWLLIQHADHDVAFQRKVLKLMQTAAKKNPKDTLKWNMAMLEDRILVNLKKRQLYGSQFRLNKKNKFVPFPIKDIKNIDVRRKECAMSPFQDQLDWAKKYKPKRKK